MLLTIFGAYIIINLVLAVVTIRYIQAYEKVFEDETQNEENWNLKIVHQLGIIKKR